MREYDDEVGAIVDAGVTGIDGNEVAMIVPREAVTWSAWMIWPDRTPQRLSHQETPRTPRLVQHPIGELVYGGKVELREVVHRWGEGTFRLQWWDADNKSLGKTDAFVLGEPTHEADPDEEDEEDDGDEYEDGDLPAHTDVAADGYQVPTSGARVTSDPLGPTLTAPMPQPAAVAPPMAAPPIPTPAADPLGASMALFQMHWTMAERARAEARAEAELQLRRYEIDRRESLERQRMQHEQELERNRVFYRELQRGPQNQVDPMTMMREMRRMISDEMQEIEERVAERSGQGPAQQEESTASAIVGALKEAGPILMPLVTNALGNNSGGSA